MLPTWFQELLLSSNWGLTVCQPTIQCYRSDLLFWVEVIKGPEWHYIVLKWANNSVGIRSGTANRSPPSLIAVHLLCSKPAVVVPSVHCTLFNMTTILNHSVAETKNANTGIPGFTLLMWGPQKTHGNKNRVNQSYLVVLKERKIRECVSMGAAGAQTRRSLGHHLLHLLIWGF